MPSKETVLGFNEDNGDREIFRSIIDSVARDVNDAMSNENSDLYKLIISAIFNVDVDKVVPLRRAPPCGVIGHRSCW